jgi:alpha-tubulin suppressor-like RCC1 family protein
MHNYLKYFKTLFFILFLVPGMSYANLTGKKWSDISVGYSHVVALDYKGELWSWGVNSNGQLGLGSNTTKNKYDAPQKIDVFDEDHQETVKFKKVFASWSSTIAISERNELWAWGANFNGLLGLSTNDTQVDAPQKVRIFHNKSGELITQQLQIKHAVITKVSGFALTIDNKMFVWGDNRENSLYPSYSITDETPELPIIKQPREITFDNLPEGINPNYIAAGQAGNYSYMFVLGDNGQLFSWGSNVGRSLGVDTLLSKVNVPVEVMHPANGSWRFVITKKDTVLAVDNEGSVFTWGVGPRLPERLLDIDGKEVVIASNVNELNNEDFEKRFALSRDTKGIYTSNNEKNKLLLWGFNNHRNISPKSANIESVVYAPQEYVLDRNSELKVLNAIALGDDATYLLAANNEIYSFGNNINGELGFQTTGQSVIDNKVKSASFIPSQGFGFSDITTSQELSSGKANSLGIRIKGYCFKTIGELEVDDNPNTFNVTDSNKDFCQSLLMNSDQDSIPYGELWGWGDNSFYQLSNTLLDPKASTDIIDYPSPLFKKRYSNDGITENKYWIRVYSFGGSSFAIDAEGYLYAWGKNQHGQLGLNLDGQAEGSVPPGVSVVTPTKVGIKQDGSSEIIYPKFKELSASNQHVVAISFDGKTLYSWGNNSNYKLGTGTFGNEGQPKIVSGSITLDNDDKWSDIATTDNASMAITKNGRRFVWGNQDKGMLGNGNGVDQTEFPKIVTPTEIEDYLNWQLITSNTYTAFGVANNKVYSWGSNLERLLGGSNDDCSDINDCPNRVTPKLFSAENIINNIDGVISVSSSNNAQFIIDSDNQAWGWGSGTNGWLGNGNSQNQQIEPVHTAIGFELTKITGTGKHTIALDSSEVIVGWGDNTYNQLGFDNSASGTSNYNSPNRAFIIDVDGDGAPDYLDYDSQDSDVSFDSDSDGNPDEQDDDSDNDGLPDSFETDRGLDPYNKNDANSDFDKDGIAVIDEFLVYGTCDSVLNITPQFPSGIEPNCVDIPNPLSHDYLSKNVFENLLRPEVDGGDSAVTSEDKFFITKHPEKNETKNIDGFIFNNEKMNRMYFSFEDNDFDLSVGWASDSGTSDCSIDSIKAATSQQTVSTECFKSELREFGFVAATAIDDNASFLSINDEHVIDSNTIESSNIAYHGVNAIKLDNQNKTLSFNPFFGPHKAKKNWLKKGTIHFAYKASSSSAILELKLISRGSSVTEQSIWSTASADLASEEWTIVKVELEEDKYSQLTWELTSDDTVWLDAISFPINTNEKTDTKHETEELRDYLPRKVHFVYLNTVGVNYREHKKFQLQEELKYDGDSLQVVDEFLLGTNPYNSNTDNDGISDFSEVLSKQQGGYETFPINPDSDGDLITDGHEVRGSYKDKGHITDPLKVDTDGDGLSDKEEQDGATISVDSVNVIVLSDPTEIHSDTDGISDNEELCLTVDAEEIPNCIKTNPSANDTDGDGIDDEVEIDGFNIVVNGIEIHVTSNPTLKDSNNDGLEDGFKKLNNLDPNLDDTDGDGLSDFNELDTYNTDPSMSDSDEDGIADNIELCLDATTGEGIPGCVTSNPINSDSDGDGIIDGKDNNIEVSTRYVYLDNNKNGAIEVPFVETSVAYGRQILSLVDVKTGKKAEVNGVVQEFHIPSWFTADSAKIVRNSNKDTNPNTPETNDVVLAGNTSDGKRAWVIIDGDSGKLFQSLAFPSWFTPLKMQVVPDVTGNFKDEILMFGSTSDNKRVWMSHDTGTRIEVSRAVYPSWFIPSELVIVPESTDLAIKKYDVFTYGVKTDNNYAHFVNSIKPSTQKAALNQANEVKSSTSVNSVDEQGNLGIVLHEVMSDNIHQITTKLARGYTAVNGNVPSINAVKLASGWQFEQIASFDDTSNEAALSKFASLESRDLASKQLTIRNPDLSVLKVVQLQNTSSYDNSFDFTEGYDWKILSNLNLQSMVNIPDFDDDKIDDILISGTSLVNGEEVNILIVYSSNATQKPLKLHNMHNLKSLH